jgi:O-methyltransferase domain
MSDLSTQEGLAIREAYDFVGCHTVVDVGGGRGGFLAILLQAFPALTGVLMDLPAVVEGAHAVFNTAALRGRCQLVGRDFLAAVPAGGDLYILKRILVDRTDDEARTLLWKGSTLGIVVMGTRALTFPILLSVGQTNPALVRHTPCGHRGCVAPRCALSGSSNFTPPDWRRH